MKTKAYSLAALVAIRDWITLHAKCIWSRITYRAAVIWSWLKSWFVKLADDVPHDVPATVVAAGEALAVQDVESAEQTAVRTLGLYAWLVMTGICLTALLFVVYANHRYSGTVIPGADVPAVTDAERIAALNREVANLDAELDQCSNELAGIRRGAIAPLMILPPTGIPSPSPSPIVEVPVVPAVSSFPPVRAEEASQPPKAKRRARRAPKPVYDPFQPAFWSQDPAVLLGALP